jgi:hypothetical protein
MVASKRRVTHGDLEVHRDELEVHRDDSHTRHGGLHFRDGWPVASIAVSILPFWIFRGVTGIMVASVGVAIGLALFLAERKV